MSTNATEKQVVDIEAQAQAKLSLLREHADRLADVANGVIQTACHPEIAMRSVLVPLEPIRSALSAYREAFPATPNTP